MEQFLTLNIYILIGISLLALILSLYQWKKTELAGKFIAGGIALNITGTLISMCFGKLYDSTPGLYLTYYMIDLALQSLFFNYSIPEFRKRNIGIFVLAGGCIVLVVTLFIVHPIRNNYPSFLSYQALSAIILSLISIYIMVDKYERRVLRKIPVFWFTVCLLFNWGLSYVYWVAFYVLFLKAHVFEMATFFITIVNDLYYVVLGLAFLLYRDKNLTINN